MDRTKTIGNYTFDEKEHCHTLDGKPLIGVTTALGVISKPMLIQWSANMAVEYIQDALDEGLEINEDVLKEAKTAHRKKKIIAGDIGTQIHSEVERWVNEYIKTGEYSQIVPTGNEIVDQCVSNFTGWAVDNQVKFLESEKHVYSKELWIGGILDLVFEMDGKKYIGDIKTSSGIYNEAFYQMGAYHLCLEEMGEAQNIEGYIVINLKKDGKMDLKMADQLDINKETFRHALALYKLINSVK